MEMPKPTAIAKSFMDDLEDLTLPNVGDNYQNDEHVDPVSALESSENMSILNAKMGNNLDICSSIVYCHILVQNIFLFRCINQEYGHNNNGNASES